MTIFKDYLDKTSDELEQLLIAEKKKSFEQRQDISSQILSDTSLLSKTRKEIARIKTAMNFKKIEDGGTK